MCVLLFTVLYNCCTVRCTRPLAQACASWGLKSGGTSTLPPLHQQVTCFAALMLTRVALSVSQKNLFTLTIDSCTHVQSRQHCPHDCKAGKITSSETPGIGLLPKICILTYSDMSAL